MKFALLLIFFLAFTPLLAYGSDYPKAVIKEAQRLLEQAKISYVYGGYQVGSNGQCAACSGCLERQQPQPKERWTRCPSCIACSLDCSHFTQLVYQAAGLWYPYLTTSAMNSLPRAVLAKRYSLHDLGRLAVRAQPGDMLVYKGHVVLLERHRGSGKGDIIHATGGRDLIGPGAGIQRERFVSLDGFRGPLVRILRHDRLYKSAKRSVSRLRPIGGSGKANKQ